MIKKKLAGLFACILFITIAIPVSGNANNLFDACSNKSSFLYLNNGWIDNKGDIKILHLNGSYYEMGYQHGFLLKDEIEENIRAFLDFSSKRGFTYEDFLEIWEIMKNYLPQPYLDELQGISDGSGLSFDDISILNIGFFIMINCGSFTAWGSATIDGKLIHARSSDYSLSVRDPITGTCVQENQFLMVRKPIDAYASLAISIAGEVGTQSGINEKGIGIGMLSSWSRSETHNGIEIGFRVRMVLDNAASDTEAIDIITSNRTLGYNCILSDGKIPKGYAVETNADSFYVGTWDTQSESNKPFTKIIDAVRRANIYADPAMAASQREEYNPGTFPLLSISLHKNKMGGTNISAAGPWTHYVAISKGIKKLWGKMDLNNSMNMLRDVYHGKTDIRFFILQLYQSYKTVHQWVACPETGDILVSFATKDRNAFENPVYYFNLFDLLNDEPC
jgi:hypothetical protein